MGTQGCQMNEIVLIINEKNEIGYEHRYKFFWERMLYKEDGLMVQYVSFNKGRDWQLNSEQLERYD